jgi:hypothetical protein
MKEFARANFHNEEDVDQLECRRHHDEEIASNDGLWRDCAQTSSSVAPGLQDAEATWACNAERCVVKSECRSSATVRRQYAPHPRSGCSLPSRQSTSVTRWVGTRGRPRERDFHFQNSRNPLRCQRINVSGLTMVRAVLQSNRRDSRANVKRMASVARRGFTLRSIYKPSCLRRNRFSAATIAMGLKHSLIKVNASR